MAEIDLKYGPNHAEPQLYDIHEQYVSADDASIVVRFLKAYGDMYTSLKLNFTFLLTVRHIQLFSKLIRIVRENPLIAIISHPRKRQAIILEN